MIQLIQLQQARMKGATLLLTVDCKPTSDCCRCYGKGSCWRCKSVKAWNIGASCLPLQHGHCMNNKHIRNTSLTSNMTTIINESTNVLPNLLANSTLLHANQINQSDCKPVSDCCRCNDKTSCRRCRCVKVGNTCTNCLPLQRGHCMNNKRSWNTSLMSNTTTIKKWNYQLSPESTGKFDTTKCLLIYSVNR